MSIIYDALKKTQKTRENHHRSLFFKKLSSSKWLDLSLWLLIVVLFFTVLVGYYPRVKAKLAQRANSTTQISSPTVSQATKKHFEPLRKILEYQGNLALNGVFVSQDEKIAMINNQTYHVGDFVQGMKIINININSIKMKDAKDNVYLMRVAT